MDVPDGEYTVQSFCQYVTENINTVLGEEDFREELKVYFLLTSDDNWQRHFDEYRMESLGDITRIGMPYRLRASDDEKEARYFATLYRDGILMLFTSAIREAYEKTIQSLTRRKRGIAEMWVRSHTFNAIREHILSRFEQTQIKHFISRRRSHDKTPCKLRDGFERRFNYTGDDGKDVLKELRDLYGVQPTEVDYFISNTMELKCYEDGLFILRTINPETFSLFFELLELALAEIMEMRLVATVGFEIETLSSDLGDLRVPVVDSAEINLPNAKLDRLAVEEIMSSQEDLSFVDVTLEEGSLTFSSTVVDQEKQSVFDLSATEDTIRLIPKYNTTFESFVKFYRLVTESIDEDASWSRFSELHD